jgi:hypothetical protein
LISKLTGNPECLADFLHLKLLDGPSDSLDPAIGELDEEFLPVIETRLPSTDSTSTDDADDGSQESEPLDRNRIFQGTIVPFQNVSLRTGLAILCHFLGRSPGWYQGIIVGYDDERGHEVNFQDGWCHRRLTKRAYGAEGSWLVSTS